MAKKKYPIYSPGEWVWVKINLLILLCMWAYAAYDVYVNGWPSWLQWLP